MYDMVIARNDFDDFQRVARSYGLQVDHVDPDTDSIILTDSDITDNILWAVSQLSLLTEAQDRTPLNANYAEHIIRV